MSTQPDIWKVPFEGNPEASWVVSASRVYSEKTGSPARFVPMDVYACKYRVMDNVIRCAVDDSSDTNTVIVRRPRNFAEFDPSDDRVWGPTYQFYDYWAGCEFRLPNCTTFLAETKTRPSLSLRMWVKIPRCMPRYAGRTGKLRHKN